MSRRAQKQFASGSFVPTERTRRTAPLNKLGRISRIVLYDALVPRRYRLPKPSARMATELTAYSFHVPARRSASRYTTSANVDSIFRKYNSPPTRSTATAAEDT